MKPKTTIELLDAFTEAAKAHGYYEDQGNESEAKHARRRFNAARKKLTDRLDALYVALNAADVALAESRYTQGDKTHAAHLLVQRTLHNED